MEESAVRPMLLRKLVPVGGVNGYVLSTARVAKLVDARDLKSLGRKPMQVRVLPRASSRHAMGYVASARP